MVSERCPMVLGRFQMVWEGVIWYQKGVRCFWEVVRWSGVNSTNRQNPSIQKDCEFTFRLKMSQTCGTSIFWLEAPFQTAWAWRRRNARGGRGWLNELMNHWIMLLFVAPGSAKYVWENIRDSFDYITYMESQYLTLPPFPLLCLIWQRTNDNRGWHKCKGGGALSMKNNCTV